MRIYKLILVSLTTMAIGQSALACIGDPKEITVKQIVAVNEALLKDYNLYASVVSMTISGDKVTVILKQTQDGAITTRIYQTVPAPNSGPASGNCDAKNAVLLQ